MWRISTTDILSPMNIHCVEEEEATGELAEIYRAWRAANPGRTEIPGILRCMSRRPDFLRRVIEFSNELHFRDGHLTRRVKEMLATLVSSLNRCPY